MKITKELLKEKSPCSDGYEWYLRKFPDGGDYQEILDALCDDDRVDDACWLLNAFGKTSDVLEVDVLERKSFVFAGSIVVKGPIKIEFSLRAGSGIKAGWGIEAGWGIKAGSGIEAGEDFGIFAALRLRISNWALSGRVTAKIKPANLMTGHWVEAESEEKQDAA